ncbi:hypothetical protein ACU686_18390 [Yinghuangia aomiensis]
MVVETGRSVPAGAARWIGIELTQPGADPGGRQRGQRNLAAARARQGGHGSRQLKAARREGDARGAGYPFW